MKFDDFYKSIIMEFIVNILKQKCVWKKNTKKTKNQQNKQTNKQ